MSGVVAFVSGYVFRKRVRLHPDYSKWLGTDYNYTYDGAGINISNHTSGYDILLDLYLMPDYTAFLSKDEVKAVPLMGFLCKVYDQLMIKRDNKPTKEERIEVMK